MRSDELIKIYYEGLDEKEENEEIPYEPLGKIDDCEIDCKKTNKRNREGKVMKCEKKFHFPTKWVNENDIDPLIIKRFYENNPKYKEKCEIENKETYFITKIDIHKNLSNSSFSKSINDLLDGKFGRPHIPINILILDSTILKTTKNIINNVNNEKINKIFIPNLNTPLDMKLESVKYDNKVLIINTTVHNFIHNFNSSLSTIWLDYTSSWESKLYGTSPKEDVKLLFDKKLLDDISIFAITLNVRSTSIYFLMELFKIANNNGYELISLCGEHTYKCEKDKFKSRYVYHRRDVTMMFSIYLCVKIK